MSFISAFLVSQRVTGLLGPKFFLLSLIASRNVPSDLTWEIPTIQTLVASLQTDGHNWVWQQLPNKVGPVPR